MTSTASATPHPLPYSYPYETLPEGQAEVEMYTDMTPLRVQADPADSSAGRLWEPWYQLQTEIEYGITDKWEFAFYQVFEGTPVSGGTNSLVFDGLKWRVRTRLAEAGELPVDIGFYLELETLHDEIALEEKVLFEKRFGALTWALNLWVEQQVERPFDSALRSPVEFVVNPTMGFTYQVTPTFQPGIEYWSRGTFGAPDTDPISAHNNRLTNFLGPAAHVNFGKFWLSLGIYANLNDATKPQPGETYGPLWARALLGIEL